MMSLFDLLYYIREVYRWIFNSNLPSLIILDISGNCNLRCKMCSIPYFPKGMMTMKTFRQILKYLPKIKNFSLSCNCEPLLNKNIIKIIKIIKNINKKAVIGFTTNGTLLTKKIAYSLIKNNLDSIQISLDGTTKKTYEKIRIGANFDVVLQNIKNLIELKKELNSKSPLVRLTFLLNKDNASEMTSLISLAYSLGIKEVIINGLEPCSKSMDKKKLWEPENLEQLKTLFYEAKKIAAEKGIRLDIPLVNQKKARNCIVSLNNCLILWNGDVVPCASLSYERPRYWNGVYQMRPKVSFGNINKSSLENIWTSKEYFNFRKAAAFGKIPPVCKECLIKDGIMCPLSGAGAPKNFAIRNLFKSI